MRVSATDLRGRAGGGTISESAETGTEKPRSGMDSAADRTSSALRGCLETCRRCEVVVNLVAAKGLEVPRELGVAFSTAAHLNRPQTETA